MPGRARQAEPNKYDAIIAQISGAGAAVERPEPLGGPAKVLRSASIRQAERGRGPITQQDPVSGFQYPISGLGTGGDGYTAEDINKILRGMPPEKIAQVQSQMKQGGLLPKDHSARGFVDPATRSRFGEILEMSNSRGSSWSSTLSTLARGEETATEMRKDMARRLAELQQSTRLNTYEASDPASVRQTAEQAFKQALGRNPRKDELEKFTSAFLGRERSSQKAVFDVQDRLAGEDRARSLEAAGIQDAAASGEATGPLPTGNTEHETLMARLKKMQADAPGKITLGPTTRDLATQQKLWARYKAGKGPMAAKPGTSKHGDGRANDLKYENDAVRQWALKNAHKYGLAFPIYDPKKSRSMDESWHVEVAKGTLPPGHSQGDGHNHGGSGAPPISTDVTVQRQDVGAQALEYAKTANPVEAEAYQVGSQFDSLLAMIQKGLR